MDQIEIEGISMAGRKVMKVMKEKRMDHHQDSGERRLGCGMLEEGNLERKRLIYQRYCVNLNYDSIFIGN